MTLSMKFEEYKDQGRAEGRAEGRTERDKEHVMNMLKKGYEPKIIADALGVSIELIKGVQDEIKH